MEQAEKLLTNKLGSVIAVPYLDSLYISSVIATVIYLVLTMMSKKFAKRVSMVFDLYAGAMTLWILIMKRDHADLVGSIAISWLMNWCVAMAHSMMEARRPTTAAGAPKPSSLYNMTKMIRDVLSVLLFFPLPSLLVRGLFSIKPAVTNPTTTTTKPNTNPV